MNGVRLLFLAVLAAFVWPAQAQTPGDVGKETGLPIPRYVSISRDEANLRVGPGGDYRIELRLLRAGMPVRIVDEEEQWRNVVLHDGTRGWLFAPLLSGARTLYVTRDKAAIRARANPAADIVAYAEAKVVLRAKSCDPAWCQVRKGNFSGWIDRAAVWGLLPQETFE